MKSVRVWVDHLMNNDHVKSGQMLLLTPRFKNVISMQPVSVSVGQIAMLLVGIQFMEALELKTQTGRYLAVKLAGQERWLSRILATLNLDIWQVQLLDEQPDSAWIGAEFDAGLVTGCDYDQDQRLGFVDLYQSSEAWCGSQSKILMASVQQRSSRQTEKLLSDLIDQAVQRYQQLAQMN